jgi:hypothetical protein
MGLYGMRKGGKEGAIESVEKSIGNHFLSYFRYHIYIHPFIQIMPIIL